MKYRLSIIISVFFIHFSCDNGSSKKIVATEVPIIHISEEKTSEVKNVILLIGDGMGLTQISAGMYAQGNQTALENFKVIGLHKPHAGDNLVTDSAAGATAFACGVKTYNTAIGVNMDTVAVESILEIAESKNMATGLVASSTIVHATPASFFAHNNFRRDYEGIATDIVDCGVDYFVGGGKKFFTNREADNRNLYDELRKNGYVISDFFEEDFENLTIDPNKKFGYITSNEDPIPVAQGRDYLIPASKGAINYLSQQSQKDGFFLMIEGSQIDWGGHANDANYVLTEFFEFDQIIQMAYDFAKADGNTLVVVTADHETGGMAIQFDSKMDSLSFAFTSTHHTGTLIPVFAYGPMSESFAGIYENTAIFDKLKMCFN